MMYLDYKFRIDEQGLLMLDKPNPETGRGVRIINTPLKVGDEFVLELNEDNCMFFRKVGPKQLDLEFNNGNKE